MTAAAKTLTMELPIDKIWDVIVDYESYPQFMDMVHEVKVDSKLPNGTRAHYMVELLSKQITYTIETDETAKPNKMVWKSTKSNLFKHNNGYWNLKSLGPNATEVTYGVDLEFSIPVPSFMLSSIIKSTLPSMMKAVEAEVIKRNGKK